MDGRQKSAGKIRALWFDGKGERPLSDLICGAQGACFKPRIVP